MLPNDYHPDDDYGVRLDVLVDGRMMAEHTRHQLRRVNVILDDLADDPVVLTPDETREIRQLQRTVQALLASKEEDVEDMTEEIERLKAEGPG